MSILKKLSQNFTEDELRGRAERAARLVEDTLVNEVLDETERMALLAFRQDKTKADTAYAAMAVVEEIRAALRRMVNAGQMVAQNEQDDGTSGESSS